MEDWVTGTVRVGISGWRYPPWRGVFYPPKLPQRRELEYAAAQLGSIEINGTFYSLQRPSSFAAWAGQTPDGFIFAVKGGRFITHMKRLNDVDAPLANFFAQGVLALGDKLGPVLWQLPPTMAYDRDLLAAFFDRLPRTRAAAAELGQGHDDRVAGRTFLDVVDDGPLRHAVEVRHSSFATDEAYELLRNHDIGLVVADSASKFPALDEVTSDFVYVRFHGDTELYTSGYDDAALDRWAARVRDWAADHDVYVYFDNDAKVRAPFDAMHLIQRLR